MTNSLSNLWGREPALILGLIQAAITLLVVFGLRLGPDQIGAILTFTGMVLSVLTRQAVVPLSTHNDAVSTALSTTPPDEKEA